MAQLDDFSKIIVGGREISKVLHQGKIIWQASGLIAGDMEAGFYGEIPASEFITGNALATAIGLTAGTAQYSNEPWLKFALDGKVLYVAKKSYRHSIARNDIDFVGAITGTKTITINGDTYKVRVLQTGQGVAFDDSPTNYHYSEYNRLMLPIHIKAKTKTWETPEYVESDLPDWNIGYTDADLNTVFGSGKGTTTHCFERSTYSNGNFHTLRGAGTTNRDASSRGLAMADSRLDYMGWRPCLELVG